MQMGDATPASDRPSALIVYDRLRLMPPFTVSSDSVRPPPPMVPSRRRREMRPVTVSGKSVEMSPFTVCGLDVGAEVRGQREIDAAVDGAELQRVVPVGAAQLARIVPLTVVARPDADVEKLTDPLTVLSAIGPLRRVASTSPLTVVPIKRTPAGTRTVKCTVTSLFWTFIRPSLPGRALVGALRRRGSGRPRRSSRPRHA